MGEHGPDGPLADEIRHGIEEASRSGDEPLAGIRDRAERFVVPSVEPGASFPRLKKLLLRILRVATRSQGTFNAIVLEGMRELEGGHAALQRQVDLFKRELEKIRNEFDIMHARFSAAEAVRPSPAAEGRPPNPSVGLPDGFYLRFEEEFRGPEDAIRERQKQYAGFFQQAPGPVLDCGCGRGEFLGILKEAGIGSYGVDSNRIAVEMARARGVDVRVEDAFSHLRALEGKLGGVAALQFVEHFDPPSVYEFLGLCLRALAPGGRLLLETINPDSLYALRAYRLDPTHRWPVPAATLDLMAREIGFESREVRWLSPVPGEETLEETSENDRKVNRWLFGPQDYAFLAARPIR